MNEELPPSSSNTPQLFDIKSSLQHVQLWLEHQHLASPLERVKIVKIVETWKLKGKKFPENQVTILM